MQNLVSKTGTRARVLNPRAALIIAIIVGGACFGMKKLHDTRFGATLTFLRSQAFAKLEKEDYRAAQRQLTQYLAFKPSDLDARERLSWVLSEQIQTRPALEQALRHNEDLLRKGFGDDSLRLRQARIAVKLNLLSDADAHLKLLQSTQSDNAEVWYLSGVCALAARDSAEAINDFKRSIRCNKPVPEAFAELAKLATAETPTEFSPDTLLTRMVSECESQKAWAIRADYYFDREDFAATIHDLWKALEPAGSPVGNASSSSIDLMRLNAMLASALQKLSMDESKDSDVRKHLLRAVRHFAALVSESPRDPNFRLYLTAVYQKLGQRWEAVSTLEDGILQNPRAFTLHTTLIDLLIDSGDTAKAWRLLESIPAGGLSRDAAAYCRGRLLMAEHKWRDAIACFEEAIGFGAKGSGLLSRAQLSLALCRSHGTDASSAVETFRSVVAENPESVSARLGMASAWVKAGQTELAIAEYRGLITVPGVAPYLADLLIQRTAAQPASLRDWSEVDDLLREDRPVIADATQRLLLRADRLFASGQILAAINTLEHAQTSYPNESRIRNAAARLHSKFVDGIRQRLEAMVAENPLNAEVHAALIRQHFASNSSKSDTEADPATTNSDSKGESSGLAAMNMIDAMADGQTAATSPLSSEARLKLTIETLQHVISLERRIGRDTFTTPLETASVRYARTLAEQNSAYERQLVLSLVKSGQTPEALNYLKSAPEPAETSHRGDAIVELVRSSADRSAILPAATNLMYELIRRHPANMGLRVSYADLLLFSSQYDLAEQTLKPLAEIPGSEAATANRRAWLRAAQLKDLDEALTMANLAVRTANGDTASRETRARVFLAKRQFEDALRELETAGFERLSLAGQIYRITALLNLEREPEATVAFEQMHVSETDRLFPADRDLLVALSERIRMPATEDSQDTKKPTRTAVSGEKQL